MIRFRIFSAIETTRQTKTPVDDRRGKLRCATSVQVMKNKKVFMRSPHEGMFLLRTSKRRGVSYFIFLPSYVMLSSRRAAAAAVRVGSGE